MHSTILSLALLLSAVVAGAGVANAQSQESSSPKTFGDELHFLDAHGKKPIVLSEGDAMVAVSPALQGRVMTSTSGGTDGPSFGWINRELIASGEVRKHINAFGGEDRLWLGPEGGQFSIFFAPKTTFDLEHWFTPAPFDTEAFGLVSQAGNRVKLRKTFHLTNYSGTQFEVLVDREVALLPAAEVWKDLGVGVEPRLKIVGFESINRLSNAGQQAWKKQSGLLSLWSIGMFNASAKTTVIVPFKAGSETDLGTPVTSDYFGTIPPDRLKLQENVIYFKADAKFRSKLGVSPRRAKPVLGSYDAENHVLTLIQYNLPSGENDYVNSAWKIQDHPYAGDVVNSYNDGPPPGGGKQLGQFYELETSSPAAELAPGGSIEHVHRTVHLMGEPAALESVSLATLGVHLTEIPLARAH